MANNVDLITWQNMDVTPVDDALVYETAIGAGGIIYGCEATIKNSNTLHINAGHAILCGRKMTVVEDDIAITLATAGVQKGRLYMQLDLSNTSTPAQLITEVSGALTPPIQDENVNIINGTYEINLYIFDVSPTEISNLVRVANPLGGILGNFAKIETRMVATQDYIKGSFLVKDNQLFKTLAAINSGELFEIGGNVKKTTVGEEIAEVNADLMNYKIVATGSGSTVGQQCGSLLNAFISVPFAQRARLCLLTYDNAYPARIYNMLTGVFTVIGGNGQAYVYSVSDGGVARRYMFGSADYTDFSSEAYSRAPFTLALM